MATARSAIEVGLPAYASAGGVPLTFHAPSELGPLDLAAFGSLEALLVVQVPGCGFKVWVRVKVKSRVRVKVRARVEGRG